MKSNSLLIGFATTAALLALNLDGLGQTVIVAPGVSSVSVQTSSIREVSGLAISRSLPHTAWIHEDSGADPVFYGLDLNTGLIHSKIDLQNAPAIDWEDAAIGPRNGGGNYLYIADIGDNGAFRNNGVDIIRLTEPEIIGDTVLSNVDFTIKRVTYPGIISAREEDAESIFVDSLDGYIYLIQKLNPGRLFRMPLAQFDSAGAYVLESLGSINAPLNKPTAADISPDGKYIIVRNSSSGGTTAYLFVRDVANNQSIPDAFKGIPISVTLQSEPQGETIAWAPDGSGFYSISEGQQQPIWFYGLSEQPASITRIENELSNLSIYPVPTKGLITLNSNDIKQSDGEFLIKINELSGRELMVKNSIFQEGGVLKFDIKELPIGIYILTVVNSGAVKVFKIVNE